MGKEIIVTTLEQMCDLMCGGPEEDEEDALDATVAFYKEETKKSSTESKEG